MQLSIENLEIDLPESKNLTTNTFSNVAIRNIIVHISYRIIAINGKCPVINYCKKN